MRRQCLLPPPALGLFAAQLSVASRAQLIALGYAGEVVDHWVRLGLIDRVLRGTYRPPGAAASPEQAIMVAVLRCGERAVAGPYESLALHGIEGFRVGAHLDVAVPAPRQVTGEVRARSLELLDGDVTTSRGIPALRVHRALFAALPELDGKRQRTVLDSVHHRGHASKSQLRQLADPRRNLPGARLMVELLGSASMACESEGERALGAVLAGIQPAPRAQVEDLVPGRRLDFAWPELRYALEYLGDQAHAGKGLSDGLRTLQLFEHGVEVQQVTLALVRDGARQLRAFVERALARRAAEVPVLDAAGLVPRRPTARRV